MEAFEDVLGWLSKFHEVHPPYFAGDDLATTFASTINVFLLTSRLDTRSVVLIAALSGLPQEFVAALMNKAERSQLFNSDEFADLSRAVHSDSKNVRRIDELMFDVMDLFWDKHLNDDDPQALVFLRGIRIFGGAYQSWVDEDELSAFLAQNSPAQLGR
jgi:hypothetical protein